MKFMVIDGNSIVNRAYYGVRPLTTKDGFYTHAIYGFITILQKLQKDFLLLDGTCVCFDLRAPTFRHVAYEGYKAQRKGMPEELAMQMPLLKEVLDAMKIPRFEWAGWEADDLIGTIARINEAAGHETVIVTGDKDSLQLVTEKTSVALVSTAKGQTTTKLVTPSRFAEEYGFLPKGMVDLKGLMGDASDNIPGVPGVGEKTAMDLVQRYGSVEEIYADLEALDVKDGVRKKLAAGAESAVMSKELATIACDAPIDYLPEAVVAQAADGSALFDVFSRLEFHKLIGLMGLHAPEAPEPEMFEGTCTMGFVTTAIEAVELLDACRKAAHVALLTLPNLSGVAVQIFEGSHGHMALVLESKFEGYNSFLKALFSADIKKVGHDVKPLMRALLAEGLPADGFIFDTAVAAYLLSPTDGSYGLERLALDYLGFSLQSERLFLEEDAFGLLGDDPAAMAAWASHVGTVECLYEQLGAKLSELGMEKLYYEIEFPLCRVLAEMELSGVLVDRAALHHYGEDISAGIAQAQEKIYALAGHEFNINSTQQLGTILFDELGLPVMKKTKTGYSTNVEVLEKLRGQHEIIDAIMDYRVLTKLKSTYVDGLGKVIEPDGRIRTTFQNLVTATGRLSSTEPNLQNIPVRTPLGAKLRYMFVAPAGHVLVDADYSQIELRLLAHIAGDTLMQEGFRSGADVHRMTAAQVFGVAPEDVTNLQRSAAKAVNFGIVYGISEFSLSQDIKVTRSEAKAYMEAYFEKYAGVKHYMEAIVNQAREQGYVATLYGRRRTLPELASSNFNLRSFGERVALNMPIQGTAADIMKLAMIRVDEALKAGGYKAKLILQVHDELIVECPEDEQEAVTVLLEQEMEAVADLSVPLLAQAAAGKNWGEAKG